MDKFNVEMKPEELVNYLRRTPKQFVDQLPGKLEEWSWKFLETNTGLTKETYHIAFEKAVRTESVEAVDPLRQEIAARIMVAHAPHAAVNVELLADYCVEAADELLKRLKR